MNRNQHIQSWWHRLTGVIASLLALVIALAGCSFPYGQVPGTTSQPGGTPTPALATVQSALSSSEGSSGTANMDCQRDGPWYLNVDENYTFTGGDAQVSFRVQGYVPLTLDQAGNVTAGATQAIGETEAIGTCHFYGTWYYTPQVTGTCRGGVMSLRVVETLGNNGVIQGPAMCENGIEEWTFPVPGTMQHDLTIPLMSTAGGGWVRIPWGVLGSPGYKRWQVSNGPELPLEPLVSPAP
jgi:hypothetical protein